MIKLLLFLKDCVKILRVIIWKLIFLFIIIKLWWFRY